MKYKELVNCICPNVILEDAQIEGVISFLRDKKTLLAYDTGLGKTFIAGACLRGLLNANESSKHLMIVLGEQEKQTPQQIHMMTGVTTIFSDASSISLNKLFKQWNYANIIIITYECFQNSKFVAFLYNHLTEITSVVIDEAHLASNWNTSNTAWLIRAFVDKVEYALALSATPVTSNRAQFPRLRNLLDRNVSYRRYETISTNKSNKGYVQVNRKDIGLKGNYNSKIIWCEPMLYQIGKLKGNIFATTKGTGAVNQANAVIEKLRECKNEAILIYVHYHDSRIWLEENLTKAGFLFASVHGKMTRKGEREEQLELFTSGKVNILVTSITTALDISADTIFFYEYTTLVKQVIGRPHRGLTPKDLNIYFFITKDTEEVDYFTKYIYYRSLDIQKLLGKDYSEIISLRDELLIEQE